MQYAAHVGFVRSIEGLPLEQCDGYFGPARVKGRVMPLGGCSRVLPDAVSRGFMAIREHPDRVVARIEMAWNESDLASVADMIDPNVSLVPREGGPVFSGRELFIQHFRRTPGWRFERRDPGGHWQTWNDTAVFDHPIVGSITRAGAAMTISAREVWVLARTGGGWSLVWHSTFERPSPVA